MTIAHKRIIVHIERTQCQLIKAQLVQMTQVIANQRNALQLFHVLECVHVNRTYLTMVQLEPLQRLSNRVERTFVQMHNRIVVHLEHFQVLQAFVSEQIFAYVLEVVGRQVQFEQARFEIVESSLIQRLQFVVAQVDALQEVQVLENEIAQFAQLAIAPNECANDVVIDGE
jgi:hypothetical protein